MLIFPHWVKFIPCNVQNGISIKDSTLHCLSALPLRLDLISECDLSSQICASFHSRWLYTGSVYTLAHTDTSCWWKLHTHRPQGPTQVDLLTVSKLNGFGDTFSLQPTLHPALCPIFTWSFTHPLESCQNLTPVPQPSPPAVRGKCTTQHSHPKIHHFTSADLTTTQFSRQ